MIPLIENNKWRNPKKPDELESTATEKEKKAKIDRGNAEKGTEDDVETQAVKELLQGSVAFRLLKLNTPRIFLTICHLPHKLRKTTKKKKQKPKGTIGKKKIPDDQDSLLFGLQNSVPLFCIHKRQPCAENGSNDFRWLLQANEEKIRDKSAVCSVHRKIQKESKEERNSAQNLPFLLLYEVPL